MYLAWNIYLAYNKSRNCLLFESNGYINIQRAQESSTGEQCIISSCEMRASEI